MKRKYFYISTLILTFLLNLTAETGTNPKREFRAVWVATVVNIDWPVYSDPPATQKQKLIDLLDNMKACGMNAIIFQVRPECDAFYESSYEPWSYWLTGEQGSAPNPYYDPLEFAIKEAHKRSMELHAWFNPYRAERKAGTFALDDNHVVNQHPDWILTFGSLKLLDPGLPMCRDYVTGVIMDVVHNYDVDGVHFDDYFYPYDGITDEDEETFANYSRGFTDIGDWRRDNVNLLVTQVFDSIKAIKSYVKFGISPFGIWKDGVPEGTWGLDAYNVIYCDAVTWLQRRIVDYLTPQIYWQFGGGQDYGKLLPWWAGQTDDRHIYPGHAAYKISRWEFPYEMPNQVRLNRQTDDVFGSVYFSAKQIRANPLGFRDSLQQDLYRTHAIIPEMSWLDSIPPNSPTNLIAIDIAIGTLLQWEKASAAADGDTARNYVIYRIEEEDTLDLSNPENILDIIYSKEFEYVDSGGAEYQSYTYLVTSLDKLDNESIASNAVDLIFTAIEEPLVLPPSDFTLNQNYPNPFNPSTVISWQLEVGGRVELTIFNIIGEKVTTLVSEKQQAGHHQIEWNASRYASGVYYYRLQTSGGFVQSKRMILIR
ncbi:MAG: family 10 glycosylhydrolase [Calditrichia bacterium]|nr:family 10 glycosylhydrolase [Calditrichia bacterium]